MIASPKQARFAAGQLLITPGAQEQIPASEVQQALSRHLRGDWGDCCPDDAQANDQALLEGGRLFSVYHTSSGLKFWIITEADRSATTVLLPDEY